MITVQNRWRNMATRRNGVDERGESMEPYGHRPVNERRRPAVNPEGGAALVVSLVTLVALLGIGTLTLLSVRSEIVSAGHTRFQQAALYASESGVAVGMEFLRQNCDATSALFSEFVTPNNNAPMSPAAILGNGITPGLPGNPFGPDSGAWYEVTVLNNPGDPQFGVGVDEDGVVLLRVVGHAPSQTRVTVEVEVRGTSCIATFCDQGYSQEGQNASNNANAVCGAQIDSAGVGLRTIIPGTRK